MTAVKRSAAVTASLLLVSGVSGCASPAPVPADVLAVVRPVSVAVSEDERAAGVHAAPLDTGESLLFWYGGREVSPGFTMAGVSYSLRLDALSEDGDLLGSVVMIPCLPASTCPTYRLDVVAPAWAETRL